MSNSKKQMPLRVQYKKTCELLDVGRETLGRIVRTDPTFPRPIKLGASKQAPVYFDYADILQWHENQKKNSSEQG